ncbi:hypothetical protein DC498_24140 [Terrimonas sp.]|uniref:HlyD family secretion protein n=1 Tax=Terrimonas sp. TaxID=1914338 RepID=UPI000D52323B|nr:HlyD family efflux transporter periplasmic adaptor subunit [Terrimonas sp.]PVD49626.1 hypothetical protein DC498_24140 [Terrimonas sp.]
MKNLKTDINKVLGEELKDESKHKNFQERSEMTQQIISHRLDFFERWSLIIFLILLLSLLVGTWYIRYPDIIEGIAVLTGDNAPKQIIPRQGGRLTALFVANNQTVKQGEVIGWIESSASTKEVINLSEQLGTCISLCAQGNTTEVSVLFNQRLKDLGELQAPYQTFVTACQKYNDYVINGFYNRKRDMLESEILSLQGIQEKTNSLRAITEKENELAKETFKMKDILFKDKVISADEHRQAQVDLINKQKNIPQLEATILSQKNQIRDKQKEIDQLNHDILQQEKIYEQALHTLKSNIDEWLRIYTIRAPIGGQVVFVMPIQQNQYIEQGKLLGYVNPPDVKYYAEVKLSQLNFGKVDTGMNVQLRFDAYPYQESGFVSGTLNYISKIAIDSGFIATVRLEKGLMTNQNKELQYKPGLTSKALIITKNQRLLERLYYNIVRATSLNK